MSDITDEKFALSPACRGIFLKEAAEHYSTQFSAINAPVLATIIPSVFSRAEFLLP